MTNNSLEKSLSNRLLESNKDLTEKVLNSEVVQNLAINGEINGENVKTIYKLYKCGNSMGPAFLSMFRSGLKNAIKEEEKTFFQSAIDAWDKGLKNMFDGMKE